MNFNKREVISMSLCPICGRLYCDHTSAERGQTDDEMMRELSDEEMEAWSKESSDSSEKIRVAKKHVHDPVK